MKFGMGESQHQVLGRYRPYFKVSVLLKVVNTSSRDVRLPPPNFELHSSPQGGTVLIITHIIGEYNRIIGQKHGRSPHENVGNSVLAKNAAEHKLC